MSKTCELAGSVVRRELGFQFCDSMTRQPCLKKDKSRSLFQRLVEKDRELFEQIAIGK